MTDSQDKSLTRLDDELAELTDALLRGESVSPSDDAAPLLRMAQRLDDLIAPREPLAAASEARLHQAVERTWDQRAPAQPKRVIAWGWMAGVAAAAAALLLVVLLIPPDASFPLALSGSAAAPGAAVAVISWRAAVFVLGIAGLVVYLLYRLRR